MFPILFPFPVFTHQEDNNFGTTILALFICMVLLIGTFFLIKYLHPTPPQRVEINITLPDDSSSEDDDSDAVVYEI